MAQDSQARPPRNYLRKHTGTRPKTGRPRTSFVTTGLGNGTTGTPGTSKGPDVFAGGPLPDSTLHLPAGVMFTLGLVGALVGICANFWQMFTSFTAFFALFLTDPRYAQMKPLDKAAAQPMISAICALIAISFQISILFLVFRINHDWKAERQAGVMGLIALKRTAVEVTQHIPLVVVWGLLGLVADTVGDYTFIALYSDSFFLIFMYAAALYASSTIMLAQAFQYFWAGYQTADIWHSQRTKAGQGDY
ncbi:MAG: hypothetical protein ACRDHW_00190 [Ktedonobacteraceae bacterium]